MKLAAVFVIAFGTLVAAQGRGQGRGAGGQAPAAPAPPQTAQQAALIDLTGYWVSVVDEDWRLRMMTPPKGDYAYVPLNAAGRKIADEFNPELYGGARYQTSQVIDCRAYGGAGLMHMPMRLHITWESPETLKIEPTGAYRRGFCISRPASREATSSWRSETVRSAAATRRRRRRGIRSRRGSSHFASIRRRFNVAPWAAAAGWGRTGQAKPSPVEASAS